MSITQTLVGLLAVAALALVYLWRRGAAGSMEAADSVEDDLAEPVPPIESDPPVRFWSDVVENAACHLTLTETGPASGGDPFLALHLTRQAAGETREFDLTIERYALDGFYYPPDQVVLSPDGAYAGLVNQEEYHKEQWETRVAIIDLARERVAGVLEAQGRYDGLAFEGDEAVLTTESYGAGEVSIRQDLRQE